MGVVGDTEAPEGISCGHQRRKETNLSKKERRMETCWRRLVMTVLCGISLFVSKTEAIKFSAEGVSVPDGVLRVDEATELGCKYIMWRQETLAGPAHQEHRLQVQIQTEDPAQDPRAIHLELFVNILAVSQHPDDANKLQVLKDNMDLHFQ